MEIVPSNKGGGENDDQTSTNWANNNHVMDHICTNAETFSVEKRKHPS